MFQQKCMMIAALAVLASAPIHAQTTADAVAPEADTALTTSFVGLGDAAQSALEAKGSGSPVTADDWMVVAANPLAVEAGADVLRAGGTAADAMIAVQAVLGLVEPQSSGLGGGAFLVWYDARSGSLTSCSTFTPALPMPPRIGRAATAHPLLTFHKCYLKSIG